MSMVAFAGFGSDTRLGRSIRRRLSNRQRWSLANREDLGNRRVSILDRPVVRDDIEGLGHRLRDEAPNPRHRGTENL